MYGYGNAKFFVLHFYHLQFRVVCSSSKLYLQKFIYSFCLISYFLDFYLFFALSSLYVKSTPLVNEIKGINQKYVVIFVNYCNSRHKMKHGFIIFEISFGWIPNWMNIWYLGLSINGDRLFIAENFVWWRMSQR